jgi:hypothetical protein
VDELVNGCEEVSVLALNGDSGYRKRRIFGSHVGSDAKL